MPIFSNFPMPIFSSFPMCAVCQRRVDALYIFSDPTTGQTVFVAKCHGETEETRIAVALGTRDAVDLAGATAFKPKVTSDAN